MIAFDAAHQAVHYPPDRRFRIWVRPSILVVAGVVILSLIAAAWTEFAIVGLPHIAVLPEADNPTSPHGFPLWLRLCHFLNFFFLMLLIRSGLSILMDHPRLYFNDHCTPGSEWIRLTPLKVPRDRLWTAKDDARYLTPLVSTPGYRHTIGIARVWHFINVHGFILTGVFFFVMLFVSEQWRRLIPHSSGNIRRRHGQLGALCHVPLPSEPNGFYAYNALQQLSYFIVVFGFGPLAILTGIAMSPAVVNRFPWYARIFLEDGRRPVRSTSSTCSALWGLSSCMWLWSASPVLPAT